MQPNYLPPGHLLNQRYSIQNSLGQGGFGITYLAYDEKLEQEVCIKELFVTGNSTRGTNMTVQSQCIEGFSFSGFVQRFVQEARKLARFQHPNIVRVLDIFQENDTAYTVMEYVRGETLTSRIQREGALNEASAMDIISQLLDAVQEVHNKDMLHRDIKPENILITSEGRIVLIDFGSAREFAEGITLTQTAILTPGYAPIEQYSERAKRGPYTDIYSLGATMYYLLTGEKPIPVTDRNLEELRPPHCLNATISSQVSSAVMLAMEIKPEHRFQSVKEMREAIQDLQNRQKEPLKGGAIFQDKENNVTSDKVGPRVNRRVVTILSIGLLVLGSIFMIKNFNRFGFEYLKRTVGNLTIKEASINNNLYETLFNNYLKSRIKGDLTGMKESFAGTSQFYGKKMSNHEIVNDFVNYSTKFTVNDVQVKRFKKAHDSRLYFTYEMELQLIVKKTANKVLYNISGEIEFNNRKEIILLNDLKQTKIY